MPRRQVERGFRLSALEEDILTLLVGRDLCAQEIIELLSAASDDYLGVVQSTPYSALPRMEEKGFVSSVWQGGAGCAPGGSRRRCYHLTNQGLNALQARRRFRTKLEALSTSPDHFMRREALNRCLALV